MARPVVGNPFENQIPTVSPTASPVETYVRPAVKKSPFEALANTLSNLERKAVPALQAEEKRRAEREFAEGQELYNKTRTSIGQAVKDGIIEEGESPYLRKGYRVANLNVLAARYANELNDALTSQKLYTNGNPAAVEEFTEKFYKNFQEKHQFESFGGVEVAEYFSSSAAKANEAFRSSWKSKHIAWQKEQNYLAWQNEVSTYMGTLFKDTDTEEARAVKMANIGLWATNKAKEAGIDGMNLSKVNDMLIESVVLSAYEMEDASILKVLDKVQTSTGVLGNTLAARKAKLNAKTNIINSIAQREAREAKAFEQQQKQTIAAGTAGALAAILDTRYNMDNPEAVEKFEAEFFNQIGIITDVRTPEALAKAQALISFRDAQMNQGEDDAFNTAEQYSTVFAEVMQSDDETDVLNILADRVKNKNILGPQALSLFNTWDRRNNRTPEERIMFLDGSTGLPDIEKQLRANFAQSLDQTFGMESVGIDEKIIHWEELVTEGVNEWKAANPDKEITKAQVRRIGREARDDVLSLQLSENEQATFSAKLAERIARESAKGAIDLGDRDAVLSIIDEAQ